MTSGKVGDKLKGKGAFTYDVSSRGAGSFEILTVAHKRGEGRGLSLADVSKNT